MNRMIIFITGVDIVQFDSQFFTSLKFIQKEFPTLGPHVFFRRPQVQEVRAMGQN